jgi:predicted HTH transcriptional regulator
MRNEAGVAPSHADCQRFFNLTPPSVNSMQTGFVTSGWCRKNLDVVYDTIRRDLIALVQLGLVKSQGRGRNARYVLQTSRE